ncbi:MAG: UvrD-helicase domain-containing protein [Planctomycetia bacterium]|nr:UvrD-helicase domain-containing protein [Planctomycetia bacterium]
MTTEFNLADDLPPNGTLIQASAGTGKTYTVAALVTLALAEDPGLRIGNVLITTFARSAAAELKHRIRTRIAATARLLRDESAAAGPAADPLDARLLMPAADRPAKARRLERALAEFDTATIGTVHSICAAILRMAGSQASESGSEDLRQQVVAEVVNDAIVAATMTTRTGGEAEPPRQHDWSEDGLRTLVEKHLGDPYIEPWYDAEGRTSGEIEALEAAARVVKECVERVQDRLRATPSFDDLLRLARDEIKGDDPKQKSFRESLHAKYRLAIVDEAQDTSRLQWEFLHLLFPPDGDRRLLSVGDPKQAIYGFRGADVTAYLHFAQGDGTKKGSTPPRTLRVNYRSDGPLLLGLNAAMAGATFGAGIPYEAVGPEKSRTASRVQGLRPVEFIDVGEARREDVAVNRVHELLTTPCFLDGEARPFRPKEICVLCRTNADGTAIAARLGRFSIPAVTMGTASVMQGQAAEDLRVLLEAMERPSDSGRARRAAATTFFGKPLTEDTRLSDEDLQAIQERIATWHAALQRKGVAAMAGAMLAETEVAHNLATGREGERRVVDLGHIVELLHDMSSGRGTPAREVLEHFTDLAQLDNTNEIVSRRVESDEDAVRIMTVHAAKGLEFPALVVAASWKAKRPQDQRGAAVFYEGTARRLDVGLALSDIRTSAQAKVRVITADNEELCRLLYVAVTRPRHHITVLRSAAWEESLLKNVMPAGPATAADIPADQRDRIAVKQATELPAVKHWSPPETPRGANQPEEPSSPGIAPLPPQVEQTYRRTSFSSITNSAAGMAEDHHTPLGHGRDEAIPGSAADEVAAAIELSDPHTAAAAGAKTLLPPVHPAGVEAFRIVDLPGGTAFGSTVHDIFERLDLAPGQPREEVTSAIRGLVEQLATSRMLRERHDLLTDLIVAALHTPFGGPPTALFRDSRLVDFSKEHRLVEMDFEMGMAGIAEGVLVSDIGRVLDKILTDGDPLRGYARLLAGDSFNVPLAGLINGQIDAVLRLPDRPHDDPRLVIVDYKTNTLHEAADAVPLAAYSVTGMAAEMAHAHYPLQALVYGTALFRMLRWRLGPRKPADWDPGECIAGIVYTFVRGMKGDGTPIDAEGRRYGVFTWLPPSTIWRRLSDLLSGDRTGVRP